MKKYALAALLLIAVVSAEVSQEHAGTLCNPYSSDSETIQVSGPVTCEGAYWLCEFSYYGNKQNLVMPVSKTSGSVVGVDNDVLGDLMSVKYAMDTGSSYLFGSSLSDESFAIQLRGMNATLQNYAGLLKSLRSEGAIQKNIFDDFNDRVNLLQESSLELAANITELSNASKEFSDSSDCVELMDYKDHLNRTLALAENFTASWSDFITRYNAMAKSLEGTAYIASINPSDVQILQRDIAGIKSGLSQYYAGEIEFKEKAESNLATRYDRKETKDRLDQAYAAVKASNNTDAIDKYNQAAEAFSEGKYTQARILAAEAIALAPSNPDTGPVVIIQKPPDYTPYFIAIGAMLGIILVIVLLKRRGPGEEEEEKEEKPVKPKKSWTWVKGNESSMERSSERLLDA